MGPNIETKENIITPQERRLYLLGRLNSLEITDVERVELDNLNEDLDEEDLDEEWDEEEWDGENENEENILTQFLEIYPYALNGVHYPTPIEIRDAAIELRIFQTVDLHEGTVSLRTILDVINT